MNLSGAERHPAVTLHVERHGPDDGPLVVCTHGGGSSSATWRAQVAGLGADRRVVTWDLRGHGASAAPEDPGAFHRDAALGDLLRVLTGAGATASAPAALAGHSFGGYLSLLVAIARPELVRGLVLIATGPGFRDPDARRAWNEAIPATAARMGAPERVLGLIAQPDSLVIDRLGDVRAPALVVVGEKDRRFGNAAGYLAAKLPDAELLVVPDAGHHVHEHRPDAVNAAIARFLTAIGH